MNGGAALSAKLKALDRYQKAVLIAMAAMILVFTALYAVTTGRVGYEYHGAILVPSGENGGTAYSGRIGGESSGPRSTAPTPRGRTPPPSRRGTSCPSI